LDKDGYLDLIQALSLLVSLVIIVVAVMKRVDYGSALLIGTVTLGILCGLSPQRFLDVFKVALTDRTTYDLALVVSLIPVLAYCMKETGMVDELIEGVKKVLSGRAVLMILPALMGALTMPGGALLSAPLIDNEARKLKLNGEDRSFINVWFRHWNFFIYPLSSSLILLASLTGISLYSLVLIQVLPLFLYLLLGYFMSVHRIEDDKAEGGQRGAAKSFLSISVNMSPILLAVLLNILGVDMAVDLALGIAFVFLLKRVKPRRIASLLKGGFEWRLPFAILGVMCFRYMVASSGAVSAILPYMQATGLSTTVFLIALSWTIGLVTAMPTAGIAIIIPMAMMAVGHLTPILASILYLTMVFAYIISPMHLCLILTVEYYKSRLYAVYRKLIPATVVTYLVFLATALTIQNWWM